MSFSEEAQALRDLYVRSPWLIDDGLVAKHFRTLKLVDKEVSIVPHVMSSTHAHRSRLWTT